MIPRAKKILTGAVLLLSLTASPALSQTTPETAPAPETAPSKPSDVSASVGTEPKLPPRTEPAASQEPIPQTSLPSLTPSQRTLAPAETKQTINPPAVSPDLVESPLKELEETPSLEDRISLDLREIDVLDVLKFLAIKANLNIVGGKGISGNVSLLLNDVTIRDAIDIILSVSRLAYTINGNIMRVTTEEEYKALYGKEFYDKRETKIVRLKFASAKNVGAMLENAKSAVGRIVYDDSTGTVVMTDTPQKIAEMEEIIRHEELPTIVRVPPTTSEIFDIEYASAAKVSEKISPALTKDIGRIYVDERSNRLIVSDMPHKVAEIRNLVKAFDTRTRSVFIEAKIVQISLSDKFQGGVDWANVARSHFQQSFPLNLASFGQMTIGTIVPQTTTNADGTTSTAFSGSGIIMKFLETFGKVSVLSTPQIAAVDGEEAKIMVGSKEAYTTSSVTQSQATTTTAQQVTFVDVGVNLKVTPTISSNGFITMKIRPEVSSVNRFITTAQGDQIPIIETTNAETTVMVKDGATVLIGGLMTTLRRKSRTGIPILSRIPILGIPFRATDNESTNRELSVLLTPHIFTGEETLPGTSQVSSVAEVTLPSGVEPAAGDKKEETGPGTLPEGEIGKNRKGKKQ